MKGEMKCAVKDTIGGVADQVAGNTKDIKDLKDAISELRNTVANDRSDQASRTDPSLVTGRRVEESRENSQFRTRKYNWARRSIKIWLVLGSCERELWDAAGNFVYRTLGVPEAELPESCVEAVRRVESARRTLANNEVLIVFADARDLVARHAPQLASKRDKEGKPTAGI